MKNLFGSKSALKSFLSSVVCFGLFALISQDAMAATTIGTMASTITASFTSVAKLITAGSYIAGLGFAIGAIMKFKQHKDNPTQITIGQPIGMLFVAAALLFLPSILSVAGATMFGDSGGVTAGPTGSVYTSGG